MVVTIIQARMDSTRLPNKVMLPVENKPVLFHVVKRVQKSKYVDSTIVATSENISNDKIRSFCKTNGIECISGSENDVLDRYYKAIKHCNLADDDIVVRITADCPLIDPQVLDEIIERHLSTSADYTSNTLEPTFPDGLDCEVIKVSALKKAWVEAKLKSEREHVTLYIYSHPEIFTLENYEYHQDLSFMRWTLDENEDYQFIKHVYKELYEDEKVFHMSDVLSFLDKRPDVSDINARFHRNEGLVKSLEEDNNIDLT